MPGQSVSRKEVLLVFGHLHFRQLLLLRVLRMVECLGNVVRVQMIAHTHICIPPNEISQWHLGVLHRLNLMQRGLLPVDIPRRDRFGTRGESRSGLK